MLGIGVGFLARWAIDSDEPLPMATLTIALTLAFSVRLLAIAWDLPDSIGED